MVCILAVQPQWKRLTFAAAVLALLLPSLMNWFGLLDLYRLPGPKSDHVTFIILGADHHPTWVFYFFLVFINVLTVVIACTYASRYRDMLDELEANNRARVLGLQRLL